MLGTKNKMDDTISEPEVELNFNFNFYEEQEPKNISKNTKGSETPQDINKQLMSVCEKIEIHEHELDYPNIDIKPISKNLNNSDTLFNEKINKVEYDLSEEQIKAECKQRNLKVKQSTIRRKKILRPFQCYLCLKRYASAEKTEKHLIEVHKEAKSKNSNTHEIFKKQLYIDLSEFGKSTPRDNSVTCGVCYKRYLTKRKLKEHIRVVHVPQKRFICPVCSKAFPTGAKLKIHTNIHYQHSIKVCDVCQKSFLNNTDLNKHKEIHNPNRTRNYKCLVCSKRFYTNENLLGHKKMHFGEKRHQCDVCQKSFFFKSLLTSHMRLHDDINKYRIFKCLHCDKGFTSKSGLKKHLELHMDTVEKFECQICYKRFRDKTNLKVHLNIHTPRVRNKECSICNKGFYDDNSLKLHLRVHTKGVESYKCTQCSQTFSLRHYLLQHMRRIHKSDRFHCMHCDKSYIDELNLNRHIKRHH